MPLALAGALAMFGSAVVTVAVAVPDAEAAAIVGLPHPMAPANGGTAGNSAGPGTHAVGATGRLVITTKVGGDRGNTNGTANPNNVVPLAGVQFAVYAQAAGATLPLPADDSSFAAWCTTDATGQCWVDVPQNGATGYTVVQIATPVGWDILTTLNTSTDGQTVNGTPPYRFHVNGNSTAQSAPPTGTDLLTSSGTWATRRTNPALPPECGLDLGVLVDLSQSVASSGTGPNGAITQIRDALSTFINLLNGTGSQMAIHTFGTYSPVPNTTGTNNAQLELTPISGSGPGSGYQTLLDKAAGLATTTPAQFTNWDRGLYSFANNAADYNAILVLTDGMPTAYGGSSADTVTTTSPLRTRLREVEEAVASADFLKSKGAHLLVIGIGSGTAGDTSNIRSISGDDPTQDFAQISDFSALETYLSERAQAACGGTVNVTKNVIPIGGSTGVPTGGWTITATTTAPIVKVDRVGAPAYGTSASAATDASGVTPFRVDFSDPATSKTLTITETPQSGHHAVAFPDGKLAQCHTTDAPGTPLAVTNVPAVNPTGFQVTALSNKSIDCTIQNQADVETAQVRVNKVWRVDTNGDGTFEETVTNGRPTTIPASAQLGLTGNAGLPAGDKAFGTVYSGLALDSTVNVSETISGLPALCVNTASYAPTLGAGGLFTLTVPASVGVNEVTITNTVTCATRLTLVKNVAGGSALPTQWALRSIPIGAAPLAGPNGRSGSPAATADVTPDAVYALAETPDPAVAANYVQDFDPTLQNQWTQRHAGGSTGSWVCVAATGVSAGVPTFGTSQTDGHNGGVQVPAGNWYRCTATNRLKPTLQLVKQIDANGTITTVPVGDTRWTLRAGGWQPVYVSGTATNGNPATITPFPGSQADVSGPGGVNATAVLPGIYTLGETGGAPGYTNGTTWSCIVNGSPVPVTENTIKLLVNDAGVCTIVNTSQVQPPVVNWTLAKAANPVSGTPVDTVGSGDADDTITYTLTATNASAQVAVDGAMAADTLPAEVTVAAAGLDPSLTLSPDGRTITWAIPHLAPSASVSVSYQVTVNAGAGGADGSTPLVNVVTPATPGGGCLSAADCTTEHPVKRLAAVVAHECVSDAAYLRYTLTPTNVPDAETLPVTATWRTQDGTVARVDTIPAGQTAGVLLWPGMVLDGNGVAVSWPGWRPLQQSDFPLPAGAQVYGTQIFDPSLPSFAYRLPMTVTFHINPQTVVDTVYPDVSPAGCAVPRPPNLTIVKTASSATVRAGEQFSYGITVSNVSTLGVAFPVTLSDPVPADVKVTRISTDTSPFPSWTNCNITGVDPDGFGGTLRCDLNGALGVSSSAPVITLTATLRASAPSGDITNTATVCWSNPSDPTQAQQCLPASAVITSAVPPSAPPGGGGVLPVTGTEVLATLAVAAGILGAGCILVLVRRRRPA